MKIMVISDIHGKASALKRALEIYDKDEFTDLLILGDIMYHGPRNPLPDGYAPAEIPGILNPLKEKILAVRGNCDSEVDQMLLEFPIMGDFSIFRTDRFRCVLTHGHLDPPRLPELRPGDLCLSGHTHIPLLEAKDGITRLNPGSLSLPKGGFPPSYGIIEHGGLSVVTLEDGGSLDPTAPGYYYEFKSPIKGEAHGSTHIPAGYVQGDERKYPGENREKL